MMHWIAGNYTKKVAAFGSLDFYGGNKPDDLECPRCPDRDQCDEYQEWPHHQYCCFRKEVDVEDNNIVMMELETGIKACYTQCHFTPDYWRNYVFIGTEGRLENLNDTDEVIVKMRNGKKWKNSADRHYTIKPVHGEHGGADPLIARDFVEMLVHDKKPLTNPIAGRMSVAVGCSAAESLRNGGKVVILPPVPAGIKKQ
jgi:hypothetical protein